MCGFFSFGFFETWIHLVSSGLQFTSMYFKLLQVTSRGMEMVGTGHWPGTWRWLSLMLLNTPLGGDRVQRLGRQRFVGPHSWHAVNPRFGMSIQCKRHKGLESSDQQKRLLSKNGVLQNWWLPYEQWLLHWKVSRYHHLWSTPNAINKKNWNC